MPELPEVETTKLGLMPLIVNQTVNRVHLYRDNLRWDIPKHLVTTLANQTINSVNRRGKYLLIAFDVGTLIIHLGMSGSILVVDSKATLKKHDHFELSFANNTVMRLNDPRRFGCVLFSVDGSHSLLDSLGVEPLSDDFDDSYLYKRSRRGKASSSRNIKGLIMDSKVVVGVGNIYACESLFKAGISPKCKASSISKKRYQTLTQCIKKILTDAIKAGGTTLQDFAQVDGKPGYFAQTLNVYGRENQPCNTCYDSLRRCVEKGRIVRIIQNQRSTFYCPKCQT